jgi:2-desacetyl-2-hydroxyethyl bacteriochlorophyllide A dehydrogenase
MKAAISHAPWEVHIEEAPTPQPGDGEVRLKVAYCGLCGSDLHRFQGSFPQVPLAAGHEISGVVEAVGPGVSEFEAADRVCVEPILYCGGCRYCRTGHSQLCDQAVFLAVDVPGGFAEYLVVPAYTLLHLPESISLEEGAMIEPLAVAVHAVAQARLQAGDSVCVLGAGTIGLLVLQVARAAGAGRVVVTAKHDHQAEAAKRLGADFVISAANEVEQEVKRLTDGQGVDVAIVTVGGRAPVGELGMAVVRKRGRVVLLGAFTERQPIDWQSFIGKEIEVVGSHTYGYNAGLRRDFEVALDLVTSGRVDVASLITHHFPLDCMADAYDIALEKRQDLIKALIVC